MNQLMKEFSVLLQREYWEHKRGVFLVPAGFAIFISLLILMASFGVFEIHSDSSFSDLVQRARSVETPNEESVRTYSLPNVKIEVNKVDEKNKLSILGDRDKAIKTAMMVAAIVFGFIGFFISSAYLFTGLYTDRKDRSVLFWKSLPFSESQAISSKLFFAMIIIPLISIFLSIIVHFSIGVGVTYLYAGQQESLLGIGAFVENFTSVFLMQNVFIFLVGIKVIPFFAWLLFCSAWSKGLPLLMSILAPVCLSVFERLLLGTRHVHVFMSAMLDFEGYKSLFMLQSGDWMQAITDVLYYQYEQIIIGLVIAVVFIFSSIWLRNNRYEI